MNKVVLVGRLTKDPELRQTCSGISVCSFTVACDRRYQKQGEPRQADFISCIAWRGAADFLCKYFKKGVRLALDGCIQTRTWDDDSGNRHYTTEIAAENIEFAQSKNEGAGNAQDAYGTVPAGDIDGFIPANIDIDDLPF